MSGCGCRSRWTRASCWPRAQRDGVAYLPGRYFAVSRPEPGALRLSFAGLTPEQIGAGIGDSGANDSEPSWRMRRGTTSRRRRWSEMAAERKESDMFQFSSEQFRLKVGLAEMLKGGVIMDVTNAEQAEIAEKAGASRGDGAGARAVRHPQRRRRGAHGANHRDHARDHGDGQHSGDGQGAHRPLHGSADSRSAGRGLHRRERSADAGRRRAPHRQARFQGAVRLRRAQSGRSAAAHRRRRGHDPHQGRGRLAATSSKRCATSAPSSRR